MTPKKSRSLVAARIRELRVAAGLTQEQLAERMGGNTPASTVSRYERAAYPPSLETLDRICAALDVSPAAFFSGLGGREHIAAHPDLRRLFDLLLQLPPQHLRIARQLLKAYVEGAKLGLQPDMDEPREHP